MATDNQVLKTIDALIRRSNPRPGSIVCIDGPAGSGKTTLAAQIAQQLNAQTIHMDDLYEGWDGIEVGAPHLVEAILKPFSQGKAGEYKRFDWHLNRYAESHHVPPADWLVVEGCTSATKLVDNFEPFIIWVEAPDALRLKRGLDRDGANMKDHWLKFMETERRIYQENDTKNRAHLKLDGFGRIEK